MAHILLTGGTGYIGTHSLVSLYEMGHTAVVYDNLSNSNLNSLDRVENITGKKTECVVGDIRDLEKLKWLFSTHKFDAVIHLAGLKSIGDAIENPIEYFDNNINGSIQLLKAMKLHKIKKLIFSSSATVYGTPEKLPITEEAPIGNSTNPYGLSKVIIEKLLEETARVDPSWSIITLRYFNPIGAHPSGLIGESYTGSPNNLLPSILQVAEKKQKKLAIFGGDYHTKDGTGVRDYVHVVDLAKGHIAALNMCFNRSGEMAINLGTGSGVSVLELLQTFEKVSGLNISYEIKDRREGDVPVCYASVDLAKKVLNWSCEYDLEDMCRHAWLWLQNNPNGLRPPL